jgi:DNA-binding response OmpR family regulator
MDVKKILIIDDEKDLCLLLKSYLSQRQHEVFIAYKLQDGLSKAIEVKPDIVFLDNNLPDGQGWDQTEWLKQQFPYLHIILMSAFKSLPRHFNQDDRIHVLEKPLSFSTLDNALESV